MPYCVECGERKSKLNRDKLCKDCSDKLKNTANTDTVSTNSVSEHGEASCKQNMEAGDADFWSKMNTLFDKKLDTLEDKLNANK